LYPQAVNKKRTDDDIGFRGLLGKQVGAVIIALDNFDVRISRREGFRYIAQKGSDLVFRMGSYDGMKD